MRQYKRARANMAAFTTGFIVLLLVIFSAVVSILGYLTFTNIFKNEYTETTYHMAETATALVNGDHLSAYLDGAYPEEYGQTRDSLDGYCRRMHVSLIYVILPDRSDYGRFVSVFNSVDNTVDDSDYTPWEMGFQRDTTNDEYRQRYREICEKTAEYATVFRTKTTDGQHPHITTLVPVKDSSGAVAGILCMQRPIRELEDARRPYAAVIGFSALLLALLSSLLAAVFIRKRVVEPVRKVAEEAGRFARENTKGEELGAISRYQEITALANSIDTMETDMVEYMEKLTSVTAEKERIGAELSFASTIQENSIPNIFPAFPDREEFDIYAAMHPAKEVGGDFYNFFFLDDDHLAMFMGDVSGKGVPAALFMMVSNILISDRAHMGGTPGEILTFVNDNLCAHNRAEMFVTVWLGILELSTGTLTAVNAGHEDPAICRGNGSFELWKTKHDLVVGAMPGVPYRENTLQLSPGDRIFLYTDGIPEAAREDGEMYSLQRMTETLDRYRDSTPKEILEGVTNDVRAFTGDAPQFDDLTMLCLELKKTGQ